MEDLQQNGGKLPSKQQIRPFLQHAKILQEHREGSLRSPTTDFPYKKGYI